MRVYIINLCGYGEFIVTAINETHAKIKLYLELKKEFNGLKYKKYLRKYFDTIKRIDTY